MIVLGEGMYLVLVSVMVVTGYCACEQCTAPYHPAPGEDPMTASGTVPVEGRSVAAGPQFDFGTELYIEGVGHRIVEDRGGAITNGRLDVYFGQEKEDHQRALRFGVRGLQVWKVREEGE